MTACPRRHCGGAIMVHGGISHCVLCGRGDDAARPPTAEELSRAKVRDEKKAKRNKRYKQRLKARLSA